MTYDAIHLLPIPTPITDDEKPVTVLLRALRHISRIQDNVFKSPREKRMALYYAALADLADTCTEPEEMFNRLAKAVPHEGKSAGEVSDAELRHATLAFHGLACDRMGGGRPRSLSSWLEAADAAQASYTRPRLRAAQRKRPQRPGRADRRPRRGHHHHCRRLGRWGRLARLAFADVGPDAGSRARSVAQLERPTIDLISRLQKVAADLQRAKSQLRKLPQRGKSMSTSFAKGDKVTQNTSQGKTTGKVVKKLTAPTDIEGHHVAASEEEPQYLVESDKTGKQVAHKPDALTKAD